LIYQPGLGLRKIFFYRSDDCGIIGIGSEFPIASIWELDVLKRLLCSLNFRCRSLKNLALLLCDTRIRQPLKPLVKRSLVHDRLQLHI
jgi:hypothetical protein